MNAGVKEAFGVVKAEMEEHLDAINQNTAEVQACHDFLSELDARLLKLEERLDELQYGAEQREFSLSRREQELFLVLYTDESPVTVVEAARRLGFTEEMVERYAARLCEKGVPLLRLALDRGAAFALDLKFRQLQARRNVLNIPEGVGQELLKESMI